MGLCCSKNTNMNIEQLNPLHEDKSVCKKCNKTGIPFDIPNRNDTDVFHMYYCKLCGESWKI